MGKINLEKAEPSKKARLPQVLRREDPIGLFPQDPQSIASATVTNIPPRTPRRAPAAPANIQKKDSIVIWLGGLAAVIILLSFIIVASWNIPDQAPPTAPATAATAEAPAVPQPSENTSPSASTAVDSPTTAEEGHAFAASALAMMDQAKAELPATVAMPRYPWKTNVGTGVFAIGEKLQKRRRDKSAWDTHWLQNYGGVDPKEATARNGYIPAAFLPRQNPFYVALPYNDVTRGRFKPEAPLVIPWFKQAFTGQGKSVLKGRWVAIRRGVRVAYAQWEDVGPLVDDHFQYVFQHERPKPELNKGAGLNVSPAVRDYLGMANTDVTDWQFVEVRDVPAGPWRSYGDNNHFVIAHRQMEQRAVKP